MTATRVTLAVSLLLNLAVVLAGGVLVHQKGGVGWLLDRATGRADQIVLPPMPLPPVDGRVLLLGDSHLALHPWAEYSPLPFADRARSGAKVQDVALDWIEGAPRMVVLSAGTNDLQAGIPASAVANELWKLIEGIRSRWPNAQLVYLVPPDPDVGLYQSGIARKFPRIHRPEPSELAALDRAAESAGATVVRAESASVDGLHMDPRSARVVAAHLEAMVPAMVGMGEPASLPPQTGS